MLLHLHESSFRGRDKRWSTRNTWEFDISPLLLSSRQAILTTGCARDYAHLRIVKR